VNGPEILHLIRHDLLRAVAERGAPPTQQPMDVSPWVGMSAMQKAIRRGREDLALSAAATLLRDAPDKLWRIGGIAYEDVGVASLGTIGLATASLGGKQARAALGGEWAVASCVIAELSRALKCRAADDLLMACELHPAYAEVRAELPYLTTRDLITVVTAQGSVHDRASRGIERRGSALSPGGLTLTLGRKPAVGDERIRPISSLNLNFLTAFCFEPRAKFQPHVDRVGQFTQNFF
jgi:hypothetical protein